MLTETYSTNHIPIQYPDVKEDNMALLVYKKFTAEQAKGIVAKLNKWFRDNPKRRVCYTELFKFRRGHIIEDVLFHCEDEVRPSDLQ